MEQHIGRDQRAQEREVRRSWRARIPVLMGLAWFLGLRFALSAAAPLPAADFGRLPMVFEPGDPASGAVFTGNSPGYVLALRPAEAVLMFQSGPRAKHKGRESRAAATNHEESIVAVGIRLLGANQAASAEALEPQPTRVNYLLGNDPARWRVGVPTFGRVRFADVYPGIDVVYYGHREELEYDFVIQPGARPETIGLEFAGVQDLRVDSSGDLVLKTDHRAVRFQKPFAYQEVSGQRREVESGYVVERAEKRRVRFQVGVYDPSRPLIVDPVLVYGTYLGGTRVDKAWTVAVDATGNAYVAGETFSKDFPVTNAFDSTFNSIVSGIDLPKDAFVAKLDPAGTNLVYATYLGGAGDDVALDIALDGAGGVWLTGQTYSTNFPTTSDAYSPTIHTTNPFGSDYDAFVTHLDSSGSNLIYSTFFGGTANDGGLSLAVDSQGNVLFAGFTESTDLPVAGFPTRYNGGKSDAFVAKFSPDGHQLLYSLYVGGNNQERAESLAVDAAGEAVLVGWTYSGDFPVTNAFQKTFQDGGADAFVAKVTADGSGLVFCTYLGGLNDDKAYGVAVDAQANIYVTGYTLSTNFPTAQALFPTNSGNADLFITKLDPAGTNLVYSTYLGGTGVEEGWSIAVDSLGDAWITGRTTSTNYPTVDPIQPFFAGGVDDVVVAALGTNGTTLEFSTYLGGTGRDEAVALAVDPAGGVYVVGQTYSTNFLALEGLHSLQRTNAGLGDAFVLKLFAGLLQLRTEITGPDQITVYWPRALTSSELQATETLGPLALWTKVAGDPTVIGNEYAVTLPATTRERYFRLRR